jgi:hypothetical protein
LRAQLLQMLYSIRSERLLMEEMDYNLLFRWFVGLNADDAVWDATYSPRTATACCRRMWRRSFWRRWWRKPGSGADFGRALHGGRHAAGGLGEPEKFSAEAEKKTPPPDDPGNPTVNFHGEKRSQRNPRIEDRSRVSAGAQRARARRRS